MHSPTYKRAFYLMLAAVLGLTVYHIMEPFWNALAWAVVLGLLLHPLHAHLTRRVGGKSGLSAGLLTLLTPVAILVPLAVLAGLFWHQMAVMVAHLKKIDLKLDDHLIERVATWPVIGAPARWLHETIPAATEHAWIRSGTDNLIGTAGAASRELLLGAGAGLADLSLALFLLFFILRDGPRMVAKAESFVPLERATRRRLLKQIQDSVRAVVFGTGVTAALQGAMVGIGFAACGLPAPVVFAFLAGLLALLPTGGAGIVWVPGVIALFAQGRAGWAVGLAVWGIVISLSDNFVRPLLVSTKVPISTLMVFIGAIGGVAGFGMVGLVLGPVLMSLCATLLDFAEGARSAAENELDAEIRSPSTSAIVHDDQ